MPCNMIAVTVIAIEVKGAEAIRNNANALEAVQTALPQLLSAPEKVQVRTYGRSPNHTVEFQIGYYRTLRIGPAGIELEGRFTPVERKALEAFINNLVMALTEQELVDALASQFQMVGDEQVTDETGRAVGRVLTVRM